MHNLYNKGKTKIVNKEEVRKVFAKISTRKACERKEVKSKEVGSSPITDETSKEN